MNWLIKDRVKAAQMRYQLRRFKKQLIEMGVNPDTQVPELDKLLERLDDITDDEGNTVYDWRDTK